MLAIGGSPSTWWRPARASSPRLRSAHGRPSWRPTLTASELVYVPADELARVRAWLGDPVHRAAAFAALCRINTLYMIARAGSGHVGSSFSCLDMVAWLHLEELRSLGSDAATRDLFFSSKGHDAPALYATLIGLGLLPFDRLHTLRRLGGLPGHPDIG